MKTSDFSFDLPDELIAQHPLEDRTASRLMVLNREKDTISHQYFSSLYDHLHPGDCLVLNNTRVLPARLFGTKDTGALVEFLLLENRGNDIWQCMVKPGKKAKIGTHFTFGEGQLMGEIVDHADEGTRLIRFTYEGLFETILDQLGTMPLPPYITERLENQERYQTVFNKELGSAAAPTAGLHFTADFLQKLKDKGVEISYVTLHVGLGTFRPVKVENVLEHHMHAEWYQLDQENAALIRTTKANGGRIVAVGTTSTRTLETIATHHGQIVEASGWTDIFIYPGYTFKAIDALVTNFHLPESTLLMLISAFYSKERIMAAYQVAVDERYRFFSFGDAMLIE